MRVTRFALVYMLTAQLSCGNGTESPADVAPEGTGTPDTQSEVSPTDAVTEATQDLGASDGQTDEDVSEVEDLSIDPADETFRVGISVRETFCPIGMPTAGYGQGLNKEETHSPFTVTFAASTTQHTPILAKTAYFRRGADELFLIRIDKIGTTQPLLDEVTRRMEARFDRPMDGKVFLASNHTHLGPGRLWENPIGEFANYLFWPAYYSLYAQDIVEAAVSAFKDAEPATLGIGQTECVDCHSDRRCENPPLLDSTLWVLPIERADGTLKAVLLDYAIHGTVFHWSDNVLSGDAPGMIEQKLEERFDHPVTALMFQSWGGDVGPADPVIADELPLSESIPEKYNRTERIGFAAAQNIMSVLPEIETSDDVDVSSITLRMPFDAALMDYEPGEFPYPNGGLLCGTNDDAPCYGEPGDPPKMGCFPLPPEQKQDQIVVSAASLGNVFFVSLPGEPLTDWALEVVARVKAVTGYEYVVPLGYTNDHWGYLMKASDWWSGGYEPTVVAWGPQQGEFLSDLIEATAHKLVDPEFVLPYEPREMLPKLTLGGIGYTPMQSTTAAEITSDVDPAPASTGAAKMTWNGGDPWYGTPLVVLERDDGGEFKPVLRQNQTELDNDTYLMDTTLDMVPSWNDDKKVKIRDFIWTVTVPIARNVPSPDALAPGKYRLRASGKVKTAEATSDYELVSAVFSVE